MTHQEFEERLGPTEDSLIDEVDLCKGCGTAKHLNSDGLCGRCAPKQDNPSKDIVDSELCKQLKTAYEIARAATSTEEGRKAIDFFYHVHLNNYPGFGQDILQKHDAEIKQQAVREFGERLLVEEDELYSRPGSNAIIIRAVPITAIKEAMNGGSRW